MAPLAQTNLSANYAGLQRIRDREASGTNLMERALAETNEDNSLDTNAKLEFGTGGHAFGLFLNAVSPRGLITDSFLDATIKDYARQCYPVAQVSPAYGVDDDLLFRGTTDLPAAFAAMTGPATFSTLLTSADKSGTTMSCQDVWDHIQSRLGDSTLSDAYSRHMCQSSGYNVGDASQLTRGRTNSGKWARIWTL